MELRHLRYLLATVDAGSVSGAAADLLITQPGLSRQLRQLERELGVELFDRRRGRLAPSPACRALVPAARALVRDADAFVAAAAFAARGRLESVTIAAPTVTLTDVVAPFIATLREDDPDADVLEADGSTPAELLDAGADLVIGTVAGAGGHRSAPLAVLPVWAYVPATHPWAGRSEVALAELLEQHLVVLPGPFTARQALDAAAAAAGLSPAGLTVASNGTVAQALAAAGRGVAVVSDDPRFGLHPLAVALGGGRDALCIRLVASWAADRAGAATVADLAARMGRFVRDRYGVPAH